MTQDRTATPATATHTRWQAWRTWLFVVGGIAFVMVNAANALYKGGDYSVFLESGRRLVSGVSLYADSSVAFGVIGPPFQSVFFAPFALLAGVSIPASRLVWYATNLCAFALGVRWWAQSLAAYPSSGGFWSRRTWADLARRRPVALATLAVIFPLQSNFEHQNLNPVLLCLVAASVLASRNGREYQSGLWIGAATALKAFPGLLLVQFAIERRWRALAAGVLTAAGLTALPLARYTDSGWDQVTTWWRLSGHGGWPIRGNNQSLFAMAARWFGTDDMKTAGIMSFAESPESYIAYGVAACIVIASVCWTVARARGSANASAPNAALTLGAAVLVSPIAWDHYWVLLFPLFLVGFQNDEGTAAEKRTTLLTAAAAVLTTAPLFLPASVWRVSRGFSDKTIAGLILIVSWASRCRSTLRKKS